MRWRRFTRLPGTFYVFVMRDKDESDQWWVFTAVGQQVVAIE